MVSSMETSHSFIFHVFLAWTFFSTFVSAHLNRRATTTTSASPSSTCGCSTYGICAYRSPNADVVVQQSTCSSCDTSCQTDSKCQFAYFAASTSYCYLWYSAFNQSSVVDCYALGSGPYVRVGCVSSSSSSSTTASSTSSSSSTTTSSTSSSSSSTTPSTSSSSSTTTPSTSSSSSTTTPSTSSSSSTTTSSTSSSSSTTTSSTSSS